MASIILVGHRFDCPLHGATEVVSGASGFAVQGRPVACVGDRMACGAVIVSGSQHVSRGGVQVAWVGDSTDHGGTLSEGANAVTLG